MLVDFWTYSCVNCIRTLPYLKAWYARYHHDGLVIVGVHTPEFAFEHVVGNVQRAVREHGIRYPVAVDDGYGTWNAWGNQYWPADYLIDRNGHVRDAHFGEGDYAETEDEIRTLLGEHGAGADAAPAGRDHAVVAASQTPETYLGTYRAHAYTPAAPRRTATPTTRRAGQRAENDVALAGHWRVESHQIVAGPGAHLLFRYSAPRIYVVAAPPAGAAGDARRRRSTAIAEPPVRVPDDDLYQLAHLPTAGPHLLDLAVPPGTASTRSRSGRGYGTNGDGRSTQIRRSDSSIG